MPARIIAICSAAAVFFGLKRKPPVEDFEARFIQAVDECHNSWIEKGWVTEKPSNHTTAV